MPTLLYSHFYVTECTQNTKKKIPTILTVTNFSISKILPVVLQIG